MARLRRADCSAAGIHRRKRGRGFSFEDARGHDDHRRGDAGADPRAGDPARLEGGLDLPRPGRPHPGDRLRRSGPQAVPLPRPLGQRRATRKYDGDARIRRRAAEAAPRRPPRHRARRDAARARPRHRRPPARPRLLPHRRRGIRGGERELRPGDDPPRARPPRGRGDRLRLPGEVEPAAHPGDRRRGGDRGAGSDAPPPRRPRGPARLEGGAALARRPLRPTSTTTSRKRSATEFSAKDFRTWSGTVLAAAALAGEEKPASDAAAKRTINRGGENGGGGARQHARGLPPLLHRPARLRPLPRRRDDRRRPPRGRPRGGCRSGPGRRSSARSSS